MTVEFRGIESATGYDRAIPIISEEVCDAGLSALRVQIITKFNGRNVCVVPILRGGGIVGEALTKPTNIPSFPIKMTYYDSDNNRMEYPRCLQMPDMAEMIKYGLEDIVLAECVVDTEATLHETIRILKDKYYRLTGSTQTPKFHVFTLVSKVERPSIENVNAAFWVDPRIWIHGMGCDNKNRGRDLPRIDGVLSPFADTIPDQPYFRPTDLSMPYVNEVK